MIPHLTGAKPASPAFCPASGLANLFAVLLAFFAALAARSVRGAEAGDRVAAPRPAPPPATLTETLRRGLGERADLLDVYRSGSSIAIRFDPSLGFAPGEAALPVELDALLSGIGRLIAGRIESVAIEAAAVREEEGVEISSRRALAAAAALLDAGVDGSRLSIAASPGAGPAAGLLLLVVVVDERGFAAGAERGAP